LSASLEAPRSAVTVSRLGSYSTTVPVCLTCSTELACRPGEAGAGAGAAVARSVVGWSGWQLSGRITPSSSQSPPPSLAAFGPVGASARAAAAAKETAATRATISRLRPRGMFGLLTEELGREEESGPAGILLPLGGRPSFEGRWGRERIGFTATTCR
jgi:hypothetical protein